jgi:hypothetical protein
VREGIVAAYVVWDNAPVTITANEAVRTAPNGDGDCGSAITEAKGFLREELADGAKSPEEIKKVAESAGLSWATVRRAKMVLKIKSIKSGLADGWLWRLPEDAQPDAKGAQL